MPESLSSALPPEPVERLTRFYQASLEVLFALLPLAGIAYLFLFQDPARHFEHHAFHELAIGLALLSSGFIAFVTWRCYACSGEPFLRWLTLAFVGFTLVYAPHGLLTRMADHNMALFLLYGPFSRALMAVCLFAGSLCYGAAPHPPARRRQGWGRSLALFLAIDLAIALIAHSALAGSALLRSGLETLAIAFCVASLATLGLRRLRSPLLTLYAVSLAAFAQSSLSFLVAQPWNHQWWLAHTIFAAGFFLLSYGVVQAFHTTRAFSTVFGQEELMRQLTEEKERAEKTLAELQCAHGELARLAATDPLTGVANRRHFLERTAQEMARRQRTGGMLAVLALDLDHFKRVNDRYGHQAGDLALQAFVTGIRPYLRTTDLLGRLGGEEFTILLPDTAPHEALAAAERIRAAVASLDVVLAEDTFRITVSIGVACFGIDGENIEAVFHRADERLYAAKHHGRNRVVADG